jgi:hypothetical protein
VYINGVPNLIQNVGLVVKSHPSQGIVSVTGVGRTNAIPNANVITETPTYVYTDGTAGKNTLNKIDPVNLLTKLQTLAQVVNTGNTVSNTINVTGLTTTGNVNVGSNISVAGLTTDYIPIVGSGHYLVDSSIRRDNGSIIISADTEITGNLYVTGNSYVVSSNNVVIQDRILGLANNNPSHDLDAGFIIEHPGHNIAFIHHGDEDRFSIGYTQNTFTDDHVLPDSNIFYLNVLGNIVVQNNLSVSENFEVGTANIYVDTSTSRVGLGTTEPVYTLDVHGLVGVSDTTESTSSGSGAVIVSGGLGVASNIHASNVFISGGLVTNTEYTACKRYSYSNAITTSNVGLTFASNVFYAKVIAQLVRDDEDVNTMVLEVQGGKRTGGVSSLDITVGTKNLFGGTNQYPWSSNVVTTPTEVIIKPYSADIVNYNYDIFVEYISSAPDGKLDALTQAGSVVKSFVY